MTPAHFGETREHPTRTWAVLKAWVLFRARLDGWDRRTPERCAVFEALARDLVLYLRNLPGSSTGHEVADDRILSWAPDVVAAVLAQ